MIMLKSGTVQGEFYYLQVDEPDLPTSMYKPLAKQSFALKDRTHVFQTVMHNHINAKDKKIKLELFMHGIYKIKSFSLSKIEVPHERWRKFGFIVHEGKLHEDDSIEMSNRLRTLVLDVPLKEGNATTCPTHEQRRVMISPKFNKPTQIAESYWIVDYSEVKGAKNEQTENAVIMGKGQTLSFIRLKDEKNFLMVAEDHLYIVEQESLVSSESKPTAAYLPEIKPTSQNCSESNSAQRTGKLVIKRVIADRNISGFLQVDEWLYSHNQPF